VTGGNFVIYSDAGVQIKAPTVFIAGAHWMSVAVLDNSNWVCCCADSAVYYDGTMIIYTEDGTEVIPKQVYETDYTRFNSVAVLQNGNWVCCYNNNTTDFGEFVIWKPYSSGVNISIASEINGVILDAEKQCNIDKIIKIDSAKLTFKWSTAKNTVNIIPSFIPYGINGNNEIDVYNCNISDNGGGICLSANKVQIHDSLIYWNAKAAAIQITGAAAVSGDITIEHNTIFDNERGIKLIANNGTNEILKNNIFHDNDVYAIDAAVAVIYSYSVNTDPVNNATAGSLVLLMNPLFKNEGADVPADVDLMLKNVIVGYPATSPAYLLADDSRDAGAYNVSYIGSITSWTSFTMEKPVEIPVSYPPVGAVKTINRDGSISTSKSGFSKLLTFPWEGVRNADFANLLLMGTCDESLVRIYLDPVTFPYAYELFYLIYSTIDGSPKAFRLTTKQ
jgi:parallel beta-helix repeat protein